MAGPGEKGLSEMKDQMTSKERVQAAIDLREPDRTPVAAGLLYSIARWAGVTVAEYISNTELHARLIRQAYEDLGGWDYHRFLPVAMLADPAAAFMFMPMRTKMPGVDLPANSIPQMDERELRFCLMGDVPAPLLKLGMPDEVEAYCRNLISNAGKGGGLILSPGCSAPDDAKFENVKAMIDTARNYRPF